MSAKSIQKCGNYGHFETHLCECKTQLPSKPYSACSYTLVSAYEASPSEVLGKVRWRRAEVLQNLLFQGGLLSSFDIEDTVSLTL